MRRVLALNYKEYQNNPLDRARFFGVLPVCEGEVRGLKRERYLWGEVLVLDRYGREGYFSYPHYTPSSDGARNALLRYAFAKVLEAKGYTLKGRIGEILVFASPVGQTVFLAVKWGGYSPSGVKRLYENLARYVFQTGGVFWFLPAPHRRFGKFLKKHPSAEPIPQEVATAGLEAFARFAQAIEPREAVSG
ncbi:hypothetical protein [Thermus scotoductus]|jgi:hypothetical protein|uniref:hypothetical protein n=1 Tax=Thermus scotoductus TaxID=37636 RepID=UPI000F800693|nr:hypothetical protein [Thermus scotoductus]